LNIGRSRGAIADVANGPGVTINGRPSRWNSTLDRQGPPTAVGSDSARVRAASGHRLAAGHVVLGGALLAIAACLLLTALWWNA
jgi:hypothetical protein